MKFVSRRGFILGIILFLSISEIHGTHLRRRRAADDDDGQTPLNWESLLEGVSKIPLIGGGIRMSLENLAYTVSKLNDLTNGAVSRIAGGYPPCTIDYDGIECTGKPENGGIQGIAEELINGTMLPAVAKTIIINFLNMAFFPLFDTIFGIQVSNKET